MNRFKVGEVGSLVAFALIGSMSLVGTSALVYERLQGNDTYKDITIGKETFSLLKLDPSKLVPQMPPPSSGTDGKVASNPRSKELDKMK
jgi:hypothetical protein